MSEPVEQLAQLLRSVPSAIVLTGAGISTDAGIPDFRSPQSGLWAQANPMKVASIQGFRDDPLGFYAFWRERFVGLEAAEPTSMHRVLAQLEARGLLGAVVTQNIDALHQKAGSAHVLEVHGSFRNARCLVCQERYQTERFLRELMPGEAPACMLCGGLVKPEVVLFGEPLGPALAQAEALIDECGALVAMGSSLQVWPVAGLLERAQAAGAEVVVVNREPTGADEYADLVILGELRDVAHALSRALDLPG